MSTIHLVAIGIGVFCFVMIALLGLLGTLEAVDYQNKKAREKNERL
jgi:tellurite resistance protein TehA-like permease